MHDEVGVRVADGIEHLEHQPDALNRRELASRAYTSIGTPFTYSSTR